MFFDQVVSLDSSVDSLGARKKQGGMLGEKLMRLLKSVDAIMLQSDMPELKERRRALARWRKSMENMECRAWTNMFSFSG